MKKIILLLSILLTQITASAFEVDALTFNIRFDTSKDGENAWPKRAVMVGEWIKSESPDVIGLQEALRHQINDIRKMASSYSEYGVGRDDNGSANFRDSKIKLAAIIIFSVPPTVGISRYISAPVK